MARSIGARMSVQNDKTPRSGPLAGLKVIDLTHVMAGPTCTLMLADMGADVIKIEKWPNGDDTRHSVPPKIGDEAASFLMMNRNKRGVVLDLKTAGGKEVLRRLISGADVLVENLAPRAMGSAHPLNAPYQAFEASDGWLVVGGANKKHWLLMLEALGAPQLASDSRFVNGSDRMAHLKELEAELGARFRKRTRAHWLAALDEKGVPCGPVHDMLEALSDPQTLAREMVVEVEHSTLGSVKTIGLPVKFSATPGKVRTGAPVYGEHTREVLREHGFDQAQIDAFEREGAIVAASAGRKEQVA